MIFSELYSAYYNTVAKIIGSALKPGTTEKDLRLHVTECAFSESVTTILPSLKSGKWPLLNGDLSPVLHSTPTMPPTLLEKRWLKAISDDPRIKLFGVRMPELDGVEPLFTRDDYKIYDSYGDGDPFEDEAYINHFRTVLEAIKENRAVIISMKNRHGKNIRVPFYPKGLEYSVKDDKIRVLADGSKFGQFNLGRILSCEFYDGDGPFTKRPYSEKLKELTVEITNERNALERAMLHFAHFEKRAQRTDDGKYILNLKYYESDETEIVIRILSFGPCVKVIEPQGFVDLIKQRLISQKNCGLI